MPASVKKAVKSTRKAKGDGHLRRAEILKAAERIFIHDGYDGATIRRIADEVGVSSTALYMHFRDKSEILFEISAQAFAELAAQNSEVAAMERDPVARIRLMLEAYIRFGLANPNVYQLVLCGSDKRFSGERQAVLNEVGLRPLLIFSGVVKEAVQAGRLRTGDARAAAQTLWATTHGLIALLITRTQVDWAPRDVLTRMTLDAVLHGLIVE